MGATASDFDQHVRAMRGECGRSRYAKRLREARREAARDVLQRHVLIVGEPGTMKTDAMKLVHFGSSRRRDSMRMLDCGRMLKLREIGAGGTAKAALEALIDAETRVVDAIQEAFESNEQGGSLLLRDVDLLPESAQQVLNDALRGESLRPVSERIRVVMTSSRAVPLVAKDFDDISLTTVRIPPLRVRRADIEDEAHFFLRQMAVEQDNPRKFVFSGEGVRALQAHDWPGNEEELEVILRRAVVQMNAQQSREHQTLVESKDSPLVISREVLWPGSKLAYGGHRSGTGYRLNLFSVLPWTQSLMRSSLWNGQFQSNFVVPVFVLLNLGLIYGPQSRDANVFLNVFWCWWWPGILITYPLVGRMWCAVCPFMSVGTLAQRIVTKLGFKLRRFPNEAFAHFGGWFLVVLFAGILMWEELWDLEDHARLSSLLLLLITSGAVIGSIFYEHRVWCRYLCPIGGMNGLFAKISATELRAEQGVCSAQCSSYGCYKGGPAVPPNGMETEGCPMGLHPAQLRDNHDCVLCGSCVQACPHGSVRFNLRPPGIDLWTTNQPSAHEVGLLFLLLGAAFCHRLPETAVYLGQFADEVVSSTAQTHSVTSTQFQMHAAAAVCALVYPGTLAFASHALSNMIHEKSSDVRACQPQAFVEEAYAYLPLCWLGLLAHFLDLGLGEAGKVLPVAARSFGFESIATSGFLPELVADEHVISFCQGTCILAGTAWSLVLLRYNAKRTWKEIAPQTLAIVLLGSQLWDLIVM